MVRTKYECKIVKRIVPELSKSFREDVVEDKPTYSAMESEIFTATGE